MKKNSPITKVAMGILVICVTIGLNSKDFISYKWETAKAQIINIEIVKYPFSTSTGTKEKQYSIVDIKYRIKENGYKYYGLIIYDNSININEFITISVNPENPIDVYFKEANWELIILFICIGLLITITGIIDLSKSFNKRKSNK